MGPDICEYIQSLDIIGHIIRNFLRLANSQAQCADNDCINTDGLNEDLRQIDPSAVTSNSLTIGYALIVSCIILMVLPNRNQILQRTTTTPATASTSNQKPNNQNDHDDNGPDIIS